MDENVWLTQEQMATLFGKSKSTINEHIKPIFEEGELQKDDSVLKFGNSEFLQKAPFFYNLGVIISVGYRVKSPQGRQFRIWATQHLKEYIIKDIYATSIDYSPKDEKTIAFFKVVQNKLLWAISQSTAAELVYRRVNASLPFS